MYKGHANHPYARATRSQGLVMGSTHAYPCDRVGAYGAPLCTVGFDFTHPRTRNRRVVKEIVH